MDGSAIEYEDNLENEKVRFLIKGGNGEVQARSEWYDNESNARRGAADLAHTLLDLVMRGEVNINLA